MKKGEQYQLSISQIKALIEDEENLIANLSNITAVLKENFQFFWVGFYLVENSELILGPFQGPVACSRIQFGKGVCGTSWKNKSLINVPDVHEFPGHIACSALSKSEIVVPILDRSGEVMAILDVDSDKLTNFNHTDEMSLSQLSTLITEKHG